MLIAEKFIQNLEKSERIDAQSKIEKAISSYYDTDENGMCPAELNAMF